MRVVFYSRPWNADLHLALEHHWSGEGKLEHVSYITHQMQTVRQLERSGRRAVFLPDAVRRLELVDPEAFLAGFEERYGEAMLPPMRLLMAERYFARRPREWQVEQLARYARLFEDLFAEQRPDLLVGEAPDMMPAWLAYELAPLFDCEVVGLIPSAIPPGRLLALRRHSEIPGARECYEHLRAAGLDHKQLAAARALQSIVTGSGTKLDYLPPRPKGAAAHARRIGNLPEHLGISIWQLRERAAGNWFVQPDPFVWQLRLVSRKLRGAWADRRWLTDPPPGGQFAFYPVHFEPEAATAVHGSYFQNQLEVIRNIARSLPADWKLVVKEHFYMRGSRRMGFYRAVRRIPNVRLVPFSVPTNELIMRAEVLVTISSTAGLEASMIGKPVVMFGDYPWDYAPTIVKLQRYVDLPKQLREAPGRALGLDHPDVMAFAASWDAALPPGRVYRTRSYDWLEPENVRRIAAALERRRADGADPSGSPRASLAARAHHSNRRSP
jgi:hypothetical protein